jgi:hypothetical protein
MWAPLAFTCTLHDTMEQAFDHFFDKVEELFERIGPDKAERFTFDDITDMFTMCNMTSIGKIRTEYIERRKARK